LRWFVSALVVFLAMGAGARAQRREVALPHILNHRGEPVENLRAWVDAVRTHGANSLDASAARIAAWEPRQLSDLKVDLECLLALMTSPLEHGCTVDVERRRPTDVLYGANELEEMRRLARSIEDKDAFLKRAAVLHSDIARLADSPPAAGRSEPVQRRGRKAPAGERGRTVEFDDGQIFRVDREADHWGFARGLLDRLTPPLSQDTSVRLWYRATLAWQLGSQELQWPHFQRAQRLYPEDPLLLYLRGCLHEVFASPRLQSVAKLIAKNDERSVLRAAHDELQDAETFLRRAIDADPGLLDARLRLGRVQSLLGKSRPAVDGLRQVALSTTDPLLLYYAHLFLGSALESLGERDDARTAYERASSFYPGATAPHLALSQLVLGMGSANLDASRAALEPVLARPGGSEDDPWWSYYAAVGRDADTAMVAAYTALLQDK
jgi:tetratricopeptide (TPR) repeat protein